MSSEGVNQRWGLRGGKGEGVKNRLTILSLGAILEIRVSRFDSVLRGGSRSVSWRRKGRQAKIFPINITTPLTQIGRRRSRASPRSLRATGGGGGGLPRRRALFRVP